MLIVLSLMICGVATGYLFRNMQFTYLNHIITTIVWLLLFLLGLNLGSNKIVLSSLQSIGLESITLASFATLGSIVGAKILWNFIQKKTNFPFNKDVSEKNETKNSIKSRIKGSLIILLFFIIGLIIGILDFIHCTWLITQADFYVLCGLMFVVGFSVGHKPKVVLKFKEIPSTVLLLPFVTMIGTWVGVICMVFFFKHQISDYLAIGSGFGYYSLSSVLISQYNGVELGTIALLSNIFREIITLLFAPLMVRFFGKLSPIAAGGATTMDTTLPVIIHSSGKEFTIVSIYNGFVMDFSVPFLVTLWCGV